MKYEIFHLIFLFTLPAGLFAQAPEPVTLEAFYQGAVDQDPRSLRSALLRQQNQLRLEQLDAERRPAISWNASASLQSEVVALPFEAPGIEPLDLPLYRVQTTMDLNYTLYDGGLVQARRAQEAAGLATEEANVRVELDQVKPQINDLFFGVLLQREKTAILANSLENLDQKIGTLEAGLRHGVVLESQVDQLRVERLRLEAQIDETQGAIRSLLAMLGELTGRELPEATPLELPPFDDFTLALTLQRPELELFDRQKDRILASEALITARWRPKVGAFAQAGLGYPNPLNFFEAKVSPFAIVGVNFKWDLFSWNQDDRERQILTVQSQLVDNQRAAFEHQLDTREGKFREDIAAVEALIERDRQIQQLQGKILKQASSQLDNGVITSSEYLDQANAEIQARLNLERHRLQLQQIKVNYLTLRGRL